MATSTASSRRRSSGASGATFFSNFVDAITEKKAADNKLKAELIKLHMQTKQKEQLIDYKNQASANNPAQQMLRRRMLESNPLAEMEIPTEENPEAPVSFPADKPDMSTAGKLVAKPLNQRDQAMLFMTKYNKMMEAAKAGQGPAPAPAMQAVYEKYFNDVNKVSLTEREANERGKRRAEREVEAKNAPPQKNLFQQAMDAILGRGGQKPDKAPSAKPDAPPAQKYGIGDTVTYKGKPYKVRGIRPNGSLELVE